MGIRARCSRPTADHSDKTAKNAIGRDGFTVIAGAGASN